MASALSGGPNTPFVRSVTDFSTTAGTLAMGVISRGCQVEQYGGGASSGLKDGGVKKGDNPSRY